MLFTVPQRNEIRESIFSRVNVTAVTQPETKVGSSSIAVLAQK